MKIKDIMRSPVMTAPVTALRADIAGLLTTHRISGVPIVDDGGAIVGLVSDSDLLAKSGATAADLMTSSVITVTPDTDVDDVRGLLIDRRIRRVPVTVGGQLVGIVSRGDIVGLMAMEWVCQVCGEAERGGLAPQSCSKCGSPQATFTQQQPPPGH